MNHERETSHCFIYIPSYDSRNFSSKRTFRIYFLFSKHKSEWIIILPPLLRFATSRCLNRWKQTLEHLIKIISRFSVFSLGFFVGSLQYKPILCRRWLRLILFSKRVEKDEIIYSSFSSALRLFVYPLKMGRIFIIPFRELFFSFFS